MRDLERCMGRMGLEGGFSQRVVGDKLNMLGCSASCLAHSRRSVNISRHFSLVEKHLADKVLWRTFWEALMCVLVVHDFDFHGLESVVDY